MPRSHFSSHQRVAHAFPREGVDQARCVANKADAAARRPPRLPRLLLSRGTEGKLPSFGAAFDHRCVGEAFLEERMVGNHVRLHRLEFLLLLVHQADDHANADVDHAFGHGEEPEVARDDRVNKVNLNVTHVRSAPLDVLPIFAVSRTVVHSIDHGLTMGLLHQGRGHRASVASSSNDLTAVPCVGLALAPSKAHFDGPYGSRLAASRAGIVSALAVIEQHRPDVCALDDRAASLEHEFSRAFEHEVIELGAGQRISRLEPFHVFLGERDANAVALWTGEDDTCHTEMGRGFEPWFHTKRSHVGKRLSANGIAADLVARPNAFFHKQHTLALHREVSCCSRTTRTSTDHDGVKF